MAQKETPSEGTPAPAGHNLSREDMHERVKEAFSRITAGENDRASANADIESARADLERIGIPRAALAAALQYFNWDEDKRRGFDRAYGIVREALGVPVQRDMFNDQE